MGLWQWSLDWSLAGKETIRLQPEVLMLGSAKTGKSLGVTELGNRSREKARHVEPQLCGTPLSILERYLLRTYCCCYKLLFELRLPWCQAIRESLTTIVALVRNCRSPSRLRAWTLRRSLDKLTLKILRHWLITKTNPFWSCMTRISHLTNHLCCSLEFRISIWYVL